MVLTRIALGKKGLPPDCAAVPDVSTRICHIMEHDGEQIETISISANSHGIRTRTLRSDVGVRAFWCCCCTPARQRDRGFRKRMEAPNAARLGSARGAPPFAGRRVEAAGRVGMPCAREGRSPLEKQQ
jgi:hypothetical protein